MLFIIRLRGWAVVITKYEKKQAILVDFYLFSHEDDYNFAYHPIISGKETKPEKLVRYYLFSKGFRFRKNDKRYPGKPDIVLPKYNTSIFVHGCFWHGHNDCKGGEIPKTRFLFWQNKIFENVSRDKKAFIELNLNAWRIAIVWECALKNNSTINNTFNNLDEWICSGPDNLELPSNNRGPEVRS